MKILDSKRIKIMLGVIWVIICIMPIIMSLFKGEVFCDSAYYICIGERISEGCIPYIDLRVGYTPLWFYVEALFKTLFHIPNGLYWPYLLLFYLFELATTYLLYRFLLSIKTSKATAFFCSGVFLLIIHWVSGNYVLLEIPFMFWGMLACWLAIEWKDKSFLYYILIGIICACSFLTKQFGLGYFILGIYVIIFIAKRDYKTLFFYMGGYIIPIAACYFMFGNKILDCVINGYGTTAAIDAGYDVSLVAKIKDYLEGLEFYFIYVCPIAAVSVLFFYESWKQNRLANMIFAYCGILGFALQFIFSFSHHYMIPLVPFGIIATTEMLTIKSNKWMQYIKYIALALLLFLAIYKTYYNRVYKQYICLDKRYEQLVLAQELNNALNNKNVFIVHGGIYHLYFTSSIIPPNLESIGYSFGPQGLNEAKCIKQINDADYVVRYSFDDSYDSYFTDSVKHMLEEYPVVAQFQDSTILLHKIY